MRNGELMLPGHQLFLQSGARRMFPHRRTWEALLRLWPAPQIMTIPALIRVLWLMFDEEGDRWRGCFQHVCTPVSWVIPSVKQEGFSFFHEAQWAAHSPWYFPPSYTVLTLSFFSHCKLFSMFLPLRIVSTLRKTTVIAKPCITKQWYLGAQYNLGFHEDSC